MIKDYSKIENLVNNIIGFYGTEALLNYLSEFELNYDLTNHYHVVKINNLICSHFNIKKSEIDWSSTKELQVRVKKCLIFYYINHTNLKTKQIISITGIARQQVDYLKKSVEKTINAEIFDDKLSDDLKKLSEKWKLI
jgi:predicted XRE-type DNA-binding protein